jgi:hypothetical protein
MQISKTIPALTLAMCASFLAINAHADQTADISVTGSIAPSSCSMSIANSGRIDLGQIPNAELNEASETRRSVESLDFQIACGGPTKMAVTLEDIQAGTVPGDVFEPIDANRLFGLGLAKGKMIGAYRIWQADFVADSAPAGPIRSVDAGASWSAANWFRNDRAVLHSWSDGVTDLPVTFTTLSGKLQVGASIRPKAELDVSEKLDLEGRATLSLHYL